MKELDKSASENTFDVEDPRTFSLYVCLVINVVVCSVQS